MKLKPTSYFQAAQRTAAQKEKEVLKKAKAAAGVGGGLQGPGQKNLIDIEEGSPQEEVQRKQQMLMQEEYDMEQLQERQRQINQLEVNKISNGVSRQVLTRKSGFGSTLEFWVGK